MTTNNSLDECGIIWIVNKSKQEISAFAYSVETISVQVKKRKGKRTADSDQVIVSVKDGGPGGELTKCHDYLQSLAVNHRKAQF